LQGPKVSITSPTTLQLFNNKTITVGGTVDDPTATISVNGVSTANNAGSFIANGVILREGSNVVTVNATNAGGAAGSAGVNVAVDTTPPIVTIDSPSNGAVLTSPQVYVTGLVNDLVPGTVNLAQVSVTINGVSAAVSNRSFMAEDVLLVPGQNVITAVATDRAGNTSQSSVTVTLVDANAQQHLIMVSGNGQSGLIGTILPQPLVVQALNSSGQPMPNLPVTFAMNKSDGLLTAFPQQGRQITLQTDGNGQASVMLQLGTRVGSGNNQVLVTSPGFVGQIMFCSTATVGSATQIHDIAGENQIGVVGQALPEPFVVVVFDAGGNPVSGVPVLFTVEQGGGNLEGNPFLTKTTDSDGRASITLTLAQQEGANNNIVSASFSGFVGLPASFVASGVTARNPATTTVSGIVLDNAHTPLVNVTASLQGTNLSAVTNADGRFTIPNAPVGSNVLLIDGSTSTAAEPYPFLEFPLVTIAGQDNHLSGPIFLPEIDSDNSKVVGGDEDVTLSMNGVPGVLFTVLAHSATFPDGSKIGKLSVSQVHSDKVPMPPPNGTAPKLFWTVQPPRVKFDPPMRVQIPNTDGLAPGTVTEIFCYNHDLEEFASSGTARVSEDGSVIVSDPGSGVIVSGWGDAPPPPPPSAPVCNCSDPNPCVSAVCVNNRCEKQQSAPNGQCHNIDIDAFLVDHDDMTKANDAYQPFSGTFVYGGAQDKTSDFLKLKAKVDPSTPVSSYAWTATGDAVASLTPPSTQEWELGALSPNPGRVHFHLSVTFADGTTATSDKELEVGVRTDDIAVIGWINSDLVPLSPAGVRADVLRYFPTGGLQNSSLAQQLLSFGYLGMLSSGLTITPTIYEQAVEQGLIAGITTLPDPTAFSTTSAVLSSEAAVALAAALVKLFGVDIFLQAADKAYLLDWQFKFAANVCPNCPPTSFAKPSDLTNFGELVVTFGHSYKLLNRLQIKYIVEAGTVFLDAQPQQVLQRDTRIGLTIDPVFGVFTFPGVGGVLNGHYEIKDNNVAHFINEGSPDPNPVRAFNTLAAPLKWNDIGSRIAMGVPFGPGKRIFTQVYPTYFIFTNGQQVDQPIVQAPDPIQNFNLNPFYGPTPLGPAPFQIP